jgi:phosphatidylserine/phosphatidylglycerophosphate/cardiolipin synthase-like enzyme
MDRSCVRIAHAKSMVIDGKVTLMGSMNWSRGAARKSENLNLVVSLEVAWAALLAVVLQDHSPEALKIMVQQTQRTLFAAEPAPPCPLLGRRTGNRLTRT